MKILLDKKETINSYFFKKEYLKSTLPVPLLFTHVPKCGGTTIDKNLRRTFRISKSSPDFETLRHINIKLFNQGSLAHLSKSATLLLLYAAEKGSTYLGGHFPIDTASLNHLKSSKNFSCITILREPYSRLVSNYIYRKVRCWTLGYILPPSSTLVEKSFVDREKKEILDFYESDEGKFQLSIYSKMFGSGSYENARETIKQYDIVGTLDRIDRFGENLSKLLGKKIKIQHLNKIKEQPYQKEVELLKKIFREQEIYRELQSKLYEEKQFYAWASTYFSS
jgi:hypothetical protein